MDNPTIKLARDVEDINSRMSQVQQKVQTALDSEDRHSMKEVRQEVSNIRKALRDLNKAKVAHEPDQTIAEDTNYDLTKLWGDQRYNPYWLKLAEYFSIKEKDYGIAGSKIGVILDWAANKAQSRKMGDILGAVGATMKKLQSPGYSERAYAVLYRYIKLESEKQSASLEAQKEINREMSAYTK